MVKRPTGSGGEPSSPNRRASAGGQARHPSYSKTSMDEQTTAAPQATESSTSEAPEHVLASTESAPVTTETPAVEPDEIQPFLEKAKETIKHCLEEPEVDKFVRAHIHTLREEWNTWSDNAKHTYTHMMTAQLLQRKAAVLGYELKLPDPSAQAKLLESLQQARKKPAKRRPTLSR